MFRKEARQQMSLKCQQKSWEVVIDGRYLHPESAFGNEYVGHHEKAIRCNEKWQTGGDCEGWWCFLSFRLHTIKRLASQSLCLVALLLVRAIIMCIDLWHRKPSAHHAVCFRHVPTIQIFYRLCQSPQHPAPADHRTQIASLLTSLR